MTGETTGTRGGALLRGSAMQQVAQGTGLLVLLAVVTVLARRLSLAELGAYGLIASLAGYLLVLRNSVASATVRELAAAAEQDRRAVFSSALVLYVIVGAITGIAIALASIGISIAILPAALEGEGIAGGCALGIVMAIGLVASLWLDALRGQLRFVLAASIETGAMLVYGTAMVGLALAGAGIGVLIATSGAWMTLSGAAAAVAARGWRFDRASADRERIRGLLPTAGALLVIELSNLVMYALDRFVLGAIRSPAAVGLYEGPVRAHNLFYALQGALAVTVLPTASRLRADGDREGLRELVLRGSRYTLALYVPVLVTLMVMAGPVLEVWLGDGFGRGATALTILVSYWLLLGALGVTPGLLVGAGRERAVARIVATAAAANLVLTLALTPSLGIEGPAVGTAVPFLVAFPFLLRLSRDATGVTVSELARRAWLPAYGLGAVLAVALVSVRAFLDPHGLLAVLVTCVVAVTAYWTAYAALCLERDERAMLAALRAGG